MATERIQEIEKEGKKAFPEAGSEEELRELEVRYFGRKSELTGILKGLKDLSADEKREVGPAVQGVRMALMEAFSSAKERVAREGRDWEAERIDVTAPGANDPLGHLHPISLIIGELGDIFTRLGFEIPEGPELETEFYNFEALNFPADHPARDMQDTFWIDSEGLDTRYVLRTHTSPVQIRYMETHTPPFRIIVPGRTFRNESTDATHEHTFHQFESLVVGEAGDLTVGHFKQLGETFFEAFFGRKVSVRLRPSYFPFVEPGFEFDISCVFCGGNGCSSCKGVGWIEVGGAGMVQQKVFEAAGYPRGQYQGFAWGFGLERLAMMKYRIPDTRMFMSGDLRFIRQF
ncbi:MAG: phenylalanine--tRNA ligase subunit alpha [Candidatus Moranbacteria bacterium]|nr:phenylalanine--tRNA ligase subunit alpha [Candidatus Moranbacteria bacterium]